MRPPRSARYGDLGVGEGSGTLGDSGRARVHAGKAGYFLSATSGVKGGSVRCIDAPTWRGSVVAGLSHSSKLMIKSVVFCSH